MKPKNAYHYVAKDLFARIVTGKYKVGGILPNEQELVEEYGLSKTVIREAIKSLELAGVLLAQQKKGTRVLDKNHWNILNNNLYDFMWELEKENCQKQTLEFLQAVLPAAAYLAALNHNSEDLLQLRDALDIASDSNEHGQSARVAAVMSFYKYTLFASKNMFFSSLATVVSRNELKETFASRLDQNFNDNMRNLYEAMSQKDSPKAEDLAKSTIRHLSQG